MIDRAVLYFATPADFTSATTPVAGRPLAFRAIAAAIRAGARRVGVPGRLRSTDVGAAVTASPRARAAVVWLEPGAPPEPGSVLLVPAAAAIPPAALATLLDVGPGAVLGCSRVNGAPALVVDAALAADLAAALAAGAAIGDDLDRALKGRETTTVPDGWCVRVRDARDAAEVRARLHADLGSAIDTRLDVALHRRLSRPITRAAVALGVTPNMVSVASLLVGLAATWCFWRAEAGSALAGLILYIAAVTLDHADGEVARLTLTESRLGEWLDVAVDNVVHALIVLAMGVTSQAVAGAGGWLGVVGLVGILGSAVVAKAWPATGAVGVGGRLEDLGSRDGFYAMLVLFIAARALAPALLPWLMVVVAVGSNAY
ncbi:MAG TPA: CDP-alcohol phosphatidyltransferase family protein, partial [Methylomirabilota bacterium]|nr:CDP-alcohol phosphatidyltransferase family protein [Methylomirabilota bacterium]